jgi:glutathione synthase
MNYIYATYFLEQAEKQGVLVVNKAQSLRDANEKLFALNFPHCIPSLQHHSQ